MNYRTVLIAVATVFSAVCLVSPPAAADTYTVNSTVDEVDAVPGDGVCATAGGACTLRAAIQTANAHAGADEIVLPAGLFQLTLYGPGENLAATGDLDISGLDPLVITGAGRDATILDGLLADRIFDTIPPGPDVTIRDLTITAGDATGQPGGGVSHSGVTLLTTARVRFVGNYANAGAAIYQNGGNLTVTDCIFEQNSVNGQGGAIHKGGPGGLTVSGSQFTDSTAAGHGGAIYFGGNTAVSLNACTFTGCESAGSGGGAYVGPAPSLTITGCLFDSCLGLMDGGAIFYNSPAGGLSITQSRFLFNSGDSNGGAVFAMTNGSCTISGSRFEDNWTRMNGGGLCFTSAAGGLTVESTDFLENTALQGTGGGIHTIPGGVVTLTNAGISDNSSTNGGGGVFVGNSSSASITQCTFTRNVTTAGMGGGGLYLSGIGAATLTTTGFDHNTANMAFGGGMACGIAGVLTISDATFWANDASGIGGRGGGLYRAGGPGGAALTNATFSSNRAGNQGGGIFAGGNTTLTNCTLADNSAPNGGGGLFTPGAPITVRNTIIANSVAGGNCSGAAITSGDQNISSDGTCPFAMAHDLINTIPHLAPLADNSGPLRTHALLGGSPAIDGADMVVCPGTDERGRARPLDGNGDGTARCDIGAFEFVGDCNHNGQDDIAEIVNGVTTDCNRNIIPDNCDSPDTDGDGIWDVCDTCTDTDHDGFGDPGFPANTCAVDGCPNDPAKSVPGACGCGAPETDTDGDGVANCVDNCPDTPNANQADANGDGVGDTCTPAPPAAQTGPCGCSPGLPFAVPLTLLGIGWMRRRVRER